VRLRRSSRALGASAPFQQTILFCFAPPLQFLDHDITLTNTNSADSLPITVPAGDTSFTPGSTMSFTRSAVAAGTGAATPRQHPNAISSFVDGSQVYGVDGTRATALRTGSGGKLATSAGDLPPFNTAGLPNAVPGPTQFLAGGACMTQAELRFCSCRTSIHCACCCSRWPCCCSRWPRVIFFIAVDLYLSRHPCQ
jgi:hypothetical protein